jgi:hypothetical protein
LFINSLVGVLEYERSVALAQAIQNEKEKVQTASAEVEEAELAGEERDQLAAVMLLDHFK